MQGPNPHLLHWQAGSFPLSPWGRLSRMTLDSVWLTKFWCWCFTIEVQKIRISPNSPKGFTHSEAERNFFTIILWEKLSFPVWYHLIPAPFNLSVSTFPPASPLSSQAVYVCLLLLILYLQVLWPPSSTGLKWRRPYSPYNGRLKDSAGDRQAFWNIKNEWKSS